MYIEIELFVDEGCWYLEVRSEGATTRRVNEQALHRARRAKMPKKPSKEWLANNPPPPELYQVLKRFNTMCETHLTLVRAGDGVLVFALDTETKPQDRDVEWYLEFVKLHDALIMSGHSQRLSRINEDEWKQFIKTPKDMIAYYAQIFYEMDYNAAFLEKAVPQIKATLGNGVSINNVLIAQQQYKPIYPAITRMLLENI